MRITEKLTQATGITMLESAIFVVLVGMVAMGSLEYYRATMKLTEARVALAEARGHLGVVADELQRQLRGACRQAGAASPVRLAATHDTLEVYTAGQRSGVVDTLRYFVNHFDENPSLIKQTNSNTPAVFAQGVDSVFFLAARVGDSERLSVVLVSTLPDAGPPAQRKRLGLTIALGAR